MSEELYYIDRLNHTKKCILKKKTFCYETLKYHEISTISECVEKFSMIIGCNIRIICLKLN